MECCGTKSPYVFSSEKCGLTVELYFAAQPFVCTWPDPDELAQAGRLSGVNQPRPFVLDKAVLDPHRPYGRNKCCGAAAAVVYRSTLERWGAQTTRNQPICILSAKPARPWALAWGGKCALTNPTIGSAGRCARGERADVADSVVMIPAPL
jgi:hypothetical protein